MSNWSENYDEFFYVSAAPNNLMLKTEIYINIRLAIHTTRLTLRPEIPHYQKVKNDGLNKIKTHKRLVKSEIAAPWKPSKTPHTNKTKYKANPQDTYPYTHAQKKYQHKTLTCTVGVDMPIKKAVK